MRLRRMGQIPSEMVTLRIRAKVPHLFLGEQAVSVLFDERRLPHLATQKFFREKL